MKLKGFTLIELMVVLAIIAVLVTIAYPGYQGQMEKSRRSDAKILLMEVMNREDVFKSNYGTYTTTIGVDGLNMSAVGKEGHYTVSAVNGPTGNIATSVTLTAAPILDGAQSSDVCGSLTLSSTGVKGMTGSGNCW